MTPQDRWWQAYLAAIAAAPSEQTAPGRAQWCAQQADAALDAFEKRWPMSKEMSSDSQTKPGTCVNCDRKDVHLGDL